jgi:hypothetical protein
MTIAGNLACVCSRQAWVSERLQGGLPLRDIRHTPRHP